MLTRQLDTATAVTEEFIASAESSGSTGALYVNFNPSGEERINSIPRSLEDPLALALDGHLISTRWLGTQVAVVDGLENAEKSAIASILNAPPLPRSLQLLDEEELYPQHKSNTDYRISQTDDSRRENLQPHSVDTAQRVRVVKPDTKASIRHDTTPVSDDALLFQADGAIFSIPCFDQSNLYFGSSNGKFYAVNKKTGDIDWQREELGRVDSDPVIFADTVVFTGGGDKVYGVDVLSGEERWQTTVGGVGGSNLRIWNKSVCVAALNQLVILSPKDGDLTGSIEFEGSYANFCFNVDQVVVVANRDLSFDDYTGRGKVTCFQVSDGTPKWSTEIGGACLGTIICDEQHCYLGARDGQFYAIRLENGEVAWQVDCAKVLNYGVHKVWADGHVLGLGKYVVFAAGHRDIGAPSTLVAVDKATGEIKWSTEHATNIGGVFDQMEDRLLAVTEDMKVIVVSKADGEMLRVFALPDADKSVAGLRVNDGHAYVVGADANVWRIRADDSNAGARNQTESEQTRDTGVGSLPPE